MHPAAPARLRTGCLVVLLVSGLYLPMLGARFDFRDDGNLVYPAAPMPLAERVALTWSRVVANWRDLGPFRPVLWAHWELQAEQLGADAARWRTWRLGWTALAAAALWWLLAELRIVPAAAACVAALVMWAPAPSEVWRSLTLSEGVAMPYAVAGLACAARAGRSRRPWAWDLAALAGTLVALGCKNTFVALVPAQMVLRLAPDGEPFGAALRARGWRAAVLGLPALLPLAHLLAFLHAWHAGQYEPGWPSLLQLRQMLAAVGAGIGLHAVLPGVLAALWAVAAAPPAQRAPFAAAWRRRRAAGRAGLALLVAGIGVYLPMDAVAGRYAIPAVWGAALLLAVLLDALAQVPTPRARRAACALLLVGVALTAGENLARQDKEIARVAVLWQALELVERQAPPAAVVAWQGTADAIGEAVHFFWHLRGRGRVDLRPLLVDTQGAVVMRAELPPPPPAPPTWLVSARATPPAHPSWRLVRLLEREYRWGRRRVGCAVWTRAAPRS